MRLYFANVLPARSGRLTTPETKTSFLSRRRPISLPSLCATCVAAMHSSDMRSMTIDKDDVDLIVDCLVCLLVICLILEGVLVLIKGEVALLDTVKELESEKALL